MKNNIFLKSVSTCFCLLLTLCLSIVSTSVIHAFPDLISDAKPKDSFEKTETGDWTATITLPKQVCAVAILHTTIRQPKNKDLEKSPLLTNPHPELGAFFDVR